MSQPGYPDPNAQPQYGQPSGQPQYGQPSAQPQYGQPEYGQQGSFPSAPPPGYGAAPTQNRPGMVTAAAVLAFISGGLGLLGSLFSFALIGGINVPGILIVFVIIGLLLSIGMIYGGVQAIQGKSFVILIALAGASIVLNLISMITYFQPSSLLGLILPILIIVFLMNPQSKAWITARGGKTLG